MVHKNKATHFPPIPKKPPSKASKQWAKFRNEDRRGMDTRGRPLAKRGKFAKVRDAIGRALTTAEYKKLRVAGYNQASHSVSIKKNKSGKLTFAITKRKKRTTSKASTGSARH